MNCCALHATEANIKKTFQNGLLKTYHCQNSKAKNFELNFCVVFFQKWSFENQKRFSRPTGLINMDSHRKDVTPNTDVTIPDMVPKILMPPGPLRETAIGTKVDHGGLACRVGSVSPTACQASGAALGLKPGHHPGLSVPIWL